MSGESPAEPLFFTAMVCEYRLPRGENNDHPIELPIRLKAEYDTMTEMDMRFESEILRNGKGSFTITHEDGDADIEIVAEPTKEKAVAAFILMLERGVWKKWFSC